jgi:uncharacterized protein YqhQ
MAKQFSYGGQAVIEGVMMRGAHKFAVAVRNPKGEIVIHEQDLNAAMYRGWVSKTPFIRGLVGLWDALGLGTRALMWSADVALDEEGTIKSGEEKGKGIFNGPLGYGTLAISLIFGIGLFFVLPTAAASGLERLFGLSEQSFLVNLLEGVVRLLLMVGYIWAISLMPDVKRLFGYHGAEHKTINAYEAGAELVPEVVAQYPIEHPRCGTAFLLTVMVISVLVFGLFGRPDFIWLVISRIVLVPVIAGIAYEYIRWTAKHMNNRIVRILIIPNLALQHLTTRNPDLSMIEVGIASFKRVLVSEQLLADEPPVPMPETMSEQALTPGD